MLSTPEGQLLHSDISDTLFLADTVGVLVGDEGYTFGAVMDLEPIPGGFAVLDGIFCRISIYDHEPVSLALQAAGERAPGNSPSPFPSAGCRQEGTLFSIREPDATHFTAQLFLRRSYPSGMGLPSDDVPRRGLQRGGGKDRDHVRRRKAHGGTKDIFHEPLFR